MKPLNWMVAFLVILGSVLVSGAYGMDKAVAPIYSNDLSVTPKAWTLHGASDRFVKRSGKSCDACHDGSNYPGSDFFRSESNTKTIFLWGVSIFAFLIFAVGMFSNISVWTLGNTRSFHREIRWPVVWRTLFSGVILEGKIFRLSYWRWFNFFSISIGFVTLFVVFLFSVIVRSGFQSTYFLEGAGANFLDFALDFLGFMILIGTLSAAIRRYAVRPSGLVNRTEDLFLIVLLFLIVVSGFLLEALRLAALPWSPDMRYSFVGNALAYLIRSDQAHWLAAHFYVWLIHGALALLLIAVMPFTKIMHFIAAPLAIVLTASEEPMHVFRPGVERTAKCALSEVATGEVKES